MTRSDADSTTPMRPAERRRPGAPTRGNGSTPGHASRDVPAPAQNLTLRALLAETEWTQETFARALGRVGAESGLRLSYDRTSVARWLRGSRPAPHVQRFMAEALSRRLGRPVAVDQLGMGDGSTGGPGPRPRGGTERSAAGGHGIGAGVRVAARTGTDSASAVTGGPGAQTTCRADQLALPADRLAALTAPVIGPPRADAPLPVPYRLTLLGTAPPLLDTAPEQARSHAGDNRAPANTTAYARDARSPTPSAPDGTHHTDDSPVVGGTPHPEPHQGPTPQPESAPFVDAARLSTARPPETQPPEVHPPHAQAPREQLPQPPRPRPSRTASPTAQRGGRPARRTTPGEVASVREHVRFFATQADRHGGGHIRTPLAACLSGLVRRLRTGGDGPHHPQLLAGAARLSYLLARVYADEQHHGMAQRAFLTAADLAREGSDPDGVALARRALGSQAHQLGHRRHSLALAEAACEAAGGGTASEGTGPSTRSFLYSGLAVARAACGERTAALDALRRAEHELARSPTDLTTGPDSPGGEPVGAYQDAALLYQSSHVRTELGDHDGAVRELRASLRLRPSGERRTRAVSHAELAELLLTRGRLEEACACWQVFLDDCALVRSGRARRAHDRMPRLLRPYAREDCVQALSARAGLVLVPPPAGRTHTLPYGRVRQGREASTLE